MTGKDTQPDWLVVGIGHPQRGDDGLGPALVARLAGRLPPGVEAVALSGEPAGLVEALGRARRVVVVDALRAGGPPGRVTRLEGASLARLQNGASGSSHGLGVAQAVGLAQALGVLPERLVVLGMEGADFSPLAPLSTPVAGALEGLAQTVLALVAPPKT